MSEVESKVQADSRALLPEDVTGSADMNLRKQIYRVVMGYIELPFKDDSGHDEDGVVVIDFIYKCIDQRPQSFIEGDHDVDCDFLQWLLSSCCLIMSKSSQMININLINCLAKLFQLLFLKDRKLFSYLTAGLLRVIKDIVVLSFSEHGNVQFPPVSLFTFHQKNFSSDLQAGILQLKSNVEINVILLSLLNLLHNLLENIGPFPMELDWNHLILLSKNHNHQIRNVSLKFIATSLSNGVTMPPQILDSLCWLLLDLLSHGPRTDYLQSLVSCCDLVFGTSDREILAPLRFFDQLAVALLQLTYTGIYKSSTIIFQDCVGHLLYNCWLVGVLSLSKIRYLLHYITDTNSNLKPFILLLEKALFNELAVISKCNESLKFHNIEHPHPAFKKKLKGSAPRYGQKRQNERKYSNSLIKLLCHIMFSCGQKLSQSIESQFASLANLETLSSILRLVAGCSVKHYEALKFWLERNEFAGMLELLDAVSVKFINSDTEYKVLKLVYTCLISIGCLMSQSDLFLAQKNQCLYILSNYSSKESIIHHKPSYNGADFQWITEIEEINLDLAIHALCALHYVCNGDILLEVVRKGMVTGVLALKVELIRILPLVMYELDSNEAILFLNELVNDAASYSWTESMLLQLSKHALLLCYIVTGVKITRSLEWRLSQETFFIDNSDYQHIVEANAPINNELLSSTYCKILNFIILNEEKSKHILISTLESSIKICSFINQDALFPLLSLMDHEDIEVVSSFGKHSAILFNLWGSYEGDISNHPFLRKLTLLALSCHTKRSKVSIDILGCLGRFKNNNVFRHCVILLLEMLLRGSIVIKAAAFNEIKELCRFHRLASGKLPLPLKHQICELLVEILNEKPFMILCSNLKKNFCAEISNVFGYKTVEEFLQSIHDPFISLLVAEGSNHVLQCLTFIAEKFNKTIGELLVANFHYIFSNLICKCSESRRSLSLQFLKTIMPDLDMVFVVRRSKILNQLLLQLYSAPSQVTVGITFLASVQKSPSSMSLSSDVEIADHLEPNFLSILKFFDAKLEIACEHEDHDLGLMAISSLTSLIVIMGSKYITKFRVNVMALLRLCQKFKNLEVCKKACEAWDCFIQSVSIPLLGPLLSEIVVVLTPWVSLFSNIITKIFTYLFITNKDSLCSYFDEVYVIPDHPFLKDINSVIKDSIISHNMSWECVLESHLKHLLKGINHQRSDVRSHAVQSLLLHLKKHQTQIQELVINRDIVHPAIADIITSLVCNLKDADSSLRLKCGECLGILGAIDPGRISYQTVTTVKAIVYFETDMLSEKFSIELIEHLKQVFLASRDAQEQNCCAFAIQEVLSVLNCANADAGKSSDGTHIWNKLPENTQEIFSPYLHSKYSPRYPKLENSADFFKLSHFKSYKDWIQKWAVTLIYRLHKSIAKQLFLPCTLIFKYNIRPAEFLLPHVLLAVLSQKDFGIITKIQNEICHILQHCDSIRDIPRDVAETVSLCSQTVFASLDYLQTWVHNKMKLQPTAKSKPMKSTNESGSQNISIVENFLKSIPKDLLAKAAFQCHAYTRALMYFQQFLKSCPSDIIQKNLKFLQEIFVGLNDVDGVSGAAAFRSSQPTIQEQILQYQSIGNYRDALLYYQKAIRENPGVKYYEDSLHCLMSLGEFQSALTYVKGLLAEKPELSHIFNSYYIEAAWKLGDWNSLEQSVKEARSSLVNWGSGLGKLLLAAKKKDKVAFQAQLQAVRNSVMGPLTAASLELGSYQRGYEHIVRLHMLQEVEDMATQVIFSSESRTVDILKNWKSRLLSTEETFRTQEPILNLRRTLLSLVDEKQELLTLSIKQETGCLWLKSASIARHSNCMQAAHNLLLHAADYHLPEYCLEHADLISTQGDPHQALLNLQKTIESWTASEEVPLATKAKAMLMVGKLLEETDHDSQTILKHYKEVIAIDGENEEGHFCLGRYYDRLLTLVEKNPSNYADVLNYTIKHYGDALTYGNRFIYHCLPRALSLWLDYGNSSASKQEKALLQSNVDKITKLMENLVDQLAPYQFLIAFSQIISRVCHHDDNVYATLEKIILILLKHYPQHSLWLMIAVSKSSNSTRKNRCKAIINKAKHIFPRWTKVIDDICKLGRCLLDVCSCESESKRTFVKMNDVCRELVRLTKSDDFSPVMVPLQSSLTVTLPACQDAPSDHNPFPGVQPSIVSFDDRVDILNSLQRPKKVIILASDGNRYTMMCKPKDDLRKDCRLMEFNTVINKFLIRDPECRQRHLHIRTYAVIPLSEDSGLVEWVDNTTGYRPILQTTYQEKGMYTSGVDVKKLLPKDSDKRNKKVLKDIFVNKILPRHPPVLGEWFMKAFPDPTSWYSSSQSFARTAAVMSIVGYMVGLGDRHGENILIDCTNGDVVHVDFSYLFNKGLTLEVPEIVPFRLTHNMVDAMGVTKYEGTFRISCEMTMKLMRQQRDPLMCVLKTLIHDPLVEWVVKTSRSQSSDKGVKIVSDIDERLQGKTGKTLPLSVKSHVLQLIKEATDIDNLCQMYIGWGPYL